MFDVKPICAKPGLFDIVLPFNLGAGRGSKRSVLARIPKFPREAESHEGTC